MKRLHIRPAASIAEEIQRLVAGETRPREGGGGTLLTEPIVVVHGTHLLAFKLFDQYGKLLGSIARSPERVEFRDLLGECVLVLREVVPSSRRYALCEPDEAEIMTLDQDGRSRWSITAGRRPIGVIRHDFGRFRLLTDPRALRIEDEPGHKVSRISVAHDTFWMQRVALVVEVDEDVSGELRKAALAASIIADKLLACKRREG